MAHRRFAEAHALLEPAIRSAPRSVDARFLLGCALRMLGHTSRAESALRAALALDPHRQDAATELARLLAALGRHEAVLVATEQAAAAKRPAQSLLIERARAFKALGRSDDLLAIRERIVALYPANPKARHNLASALGDAGLAERSEAAARQALATGGDAPETWLVLARALQNQNRYGEAERAFREAVRRLPDYAEALRDLVQLVWMRSGDLEAAAAILDGAPQSGAVRAIRAKLFEYAGDRHTAYDLLARTGTADDAALESLAAHLALAFDPGLALRHATNAVSLAPGEDSARRQLIETSLAVGQPQAALDRIAPLRARKPFDQGLIAAQWTAWRMLGDPRAAALYDYAAFVLAQPIDSPPGWNSLEAFLADLTESLLRLHQLQAHPFDQSLRHGTQTSAPLLRSTDPAIRAFIAAIDGPIRRYMAFIGTGTDPLRSRNGGGYRIEGLWSVKLQPDGFHVDHVHPMGWLSSACHIALPEDTDEAAREGWLKFGEPGTPTAPPLAAEHYVRPLPGQLVMFPSYMWHGTLPFTRGSRLSLAFDVLPT